MFRWLIHTGAVAAVAGICLLIGYSAGAQEVPAKGTPNSLQPGQIWRVGDQIVTSDQLVARIWDTQTLLKPEERTFDRELVYLRDTALLPQEAKRLGGLSITDAEVQAETHKQVSALKARIKEDSRGLVTYEGWLEQQGMSPEEFEAYVFDRARIILMKRILVRYFEETEPSIDCSHILVKTRERAEDLHKRLKAASADKLNETFEDLAVQHSEDPAAGITKGRLPRIYEQDGTLVTEAAEALWKLKDKEFSGAVKTEYGYHIFLRRETFTPVRKPLAELRATLIKAETRPNEEDYFNRWVRWVFNTQKYKVERRVPGFDCKPDQKIQEK